jgi:hypothetical protein
LGVEGEGGGGCKMIVAVVARLCRRGKEEVSGKVGSSRLPLANGWCGDDALELREAYNTVDIAGV